MSLNVLLDIKYDLMRVFSAELFVTTSNWRNFCLTVDARSKMGACYADKFV